MSDKIKVKDNIMGKSILIIISLCGYLVLQLFLIREFSGIEVAFVFLALFFAIFVNYAFVKSLPVFLLLLCIIPFVYLSDNFNYNFNYVFLQDAPIFIFLMLGVFYYVVKKGNRMTISISYLQLPVALLILYSLFSAILGLTKGQSFYQVSFEFYNIFYYFLIIPFVFLLKKDKYYKTLFYTIVLVSIIVAIEYLANNLLFRPDKRFTTFHAGFFPITAGLLFSSLLNSIKNSVKSLCLIGCLVLIIGGSFVTLTRSVWVAVLVSLAVVGILSYIKSRNIVLTKKQIFSYSIIVLFLIFSMIFMNSDSPTNGRVGVAEKSETRMESIANPTSDTSFLMRVEIAYYIVQRFLSSPIWGDGLGASMRYKIFSNNAFYYPDNSWLYMLWKGGIVGLFLFSWMYYRFFRQSYHIFRKHRDKFGEVISLGLIGGFAGSLLFSFFAANLIKYSKTNLLIVVCFAFIEYKSHLYGNENSTEKE
jgi:O-antigen ligase